MLELFMNCMEMNDAQECVEWYTELIQQFRQRFNKMDIKSREVVWGIENFNGPCQLISIVMEKLNPPNISLVT
jgi:hypothetical protein